MRRALNFSTPSNPRFKLVGLSLAAAMASCTTVGPDYHRPAQSTINQPSAQSDFFGSNNSAFAKGSVPSEWWKLYQDPTLNELVAQSLSANTDLRIAAANLARAQAGLADADASRHAELTLEGSPQYARYSAEQLLIPTEGKPLPNSYVYGMGIGVSYQLDLFGQINRATESATANVYAARAASDATRITVVAETTKAYLEACSAGHELVIAQSILALQSKSTQLTQRLFSAGRGTSLDTTRSSGQEDQIRATVPLLQAQNKLALYRLAQLTGHTPAEFPPKVAACNVEPQLQAPIPLGDGAALLARRPDVRRAEFELHAATAQIGVVTANLYPKVTLGASLGSAGLASHFLHADTVSFSLGPLISWQFPERDHVKAHIKSAEADEQAAYARFDGVVLTALRETESALEVYARDLDRRALLIRARDTARKSARDNETLFKLGRQNYLPVLDAQRTLASAEQAMATVDGKIATDQVAVFLALGGGWEQGQTVVTALNK